MEIQIISGFLGAGKTTFLNQYLPVLPGKTVVIENEFGEVGLDGDLIQGDLPVKELYAGCICCSLAIDLQNGIHDIVKRYAPDRILIEPSGVGRLSDVEKACEKARDKYGIELEITRRITIVDAGSFEDFIDGFGAFYRDQIQSADVLLLSMIEQMEEEQLERVVSGLHRENPDAVVFTGDWRQLDGEELAEIIAMAEPPGRKTEAMGEIREEAKMIPANIFESVSVRNPRPMTEQELGQALNELREKRNGQILRAKGVIATPDQEYLHFDLTPSGVSWHRTEAGKDGCKAIVIGTGLNKPALEMLFRNHISIRPPMRGRRKKEEI